MAGSLITAPTWPSTDTQISRPIPAAQLDEWLRATPTPSESATHPT
jgi:hypothetical protein